MGLWSAFLAGLKLLAAGMQWLLNRQQIEAGKAEQRSADQAAVLAADKRMQEAGARPNDTSKDLHDGTF
jgi:hypothetical protein